MLSQPSFSNGRSKFSVSIYKIQGYGYKWSEIEKCFSSFTAGNSEEECWVMAVELKKECGYRSELSEQESAATNKIPCWSREQWIPLSE